MAELTHDTPDDGFHEIQLSGKQLVFLFMATTVVSVVIFLCGVLVGRGVRAEAGGLDSATDAPTETGAAMPAAESPLATTPPLTSEPQLKYPDALSADPPKETLTDRAEPPRASAPASAPVDRSAQGETDAKQPSAAPAEPPPAAPAATAGTGPRPGTWLVQVVSLRDKAAANRLVDRLRGKGYPAFLVSPAAGAPAPMYKVQVGRFADRREAQRTSERLEKEEQFKSWIIR